MPMAAVSAARRPRGRRGDPSSPARRCYGVALEAVIFSKESEAHDRWSGADLRAVSSLAFGTGHGPFMAPVLRGHVWEVVEIVDGCLRSKMGVNGAEKHPLRPDAMRRLPLQISSLGDGVPGEIRTHDPRIRNPRVGVLTRCAGRR